MLVPFVVMISIWLALAEIYHFVLKLVGYYMQKEAVSEKKIPGRLNDERPSSYTDANSGRGNMGRSQSTSFRSVGTQRKEKKDFWFDMKEQQVQSLVLGCILLFFWSKKLWFVYPFPQKSLSHDNLVLEIKIFSFWSFFLYSYNFFQDLEESLLSLFCILQPFAKWGGCIHFRLNQRIFKMQIFLMLLWR